MAHTATCDRVTILFPFRVVHTLLGPNVWNSDETHVLCFDQQFGGIIELYYTLLHEWVLASMVPIKFVSLISTIYNKLVNCDISVNLPSS